MKLKTWLRIKLLQKREKTPSTFADSYRAIRWILSIVTALLVALATILNTISKESISCIIYTDVASVIVIIFVYYLSKFTIWILEKVGIL